MRTSRMGDETLLLAASAVEAFLVFLILGYGALYAHQHLHVSYALASQAAALPGLAWFAGAWVWDGVSRRWGFVRIAAIALASHSVLAVAVWVVHTALWLAIVLGVVSLGTSGFRPAVVGYLIQAVEGSAGARLARRVRWQSIGWLVGGVLGGVTTPWGGWGRSWRCTGAPWSAPWGSAGRRWAERRRRCSTRYDLVLPLRRFCGVFAGRGCAPHYVRL